MYSRVLAKIIRLKAKKVYRAQCIPFGLYIKDLKGICARITSSVRARVIIFLALVHISAFVLPREAASLTGRYARRMVWECAGIRWMAHEGEGGEEDENWLCTGGVQDPLPVQGGLAASQASGKATLYLVAFLPM